MMRPRKLSSEHLKPLGFQLSEPEALAFKAACDRLGLSQSEVLRRLARQMIKTPKAPLDALSRLERIEEEARRLREELTNADG